MIFSGEWRGAKGTPVSAVGEFGLIERLREIAEAGRPASGQDEMLLLGIGDDAASLRSVEGREILVTCDTQVAGRHFLPEWTSPRVLGERAITISASDIAAMGGLARAALVSLAVGPEVSVEDLEELYRGMTARLERFPAALVGGNMSGLDSGLVIDITVIGEVEGGRAVRRNTGSPGDLVWVTGAPGSAAAGLALLRSGATDLSPSEVDDLIHAYLRPTERLREGRALGVSGSVTSMIDVSDGLVGDLRHMVEGREAGIVLYDDSLPIGESLERGAARLGQTPASFVLGPSDDYELIFTTKPEMVELAVKSLHAVSDVPAWPIGHVITGGAGQIFLADADGRRRLAGTQGWNHFTGL